MGHIFLIGMPGSGKTTIGSALAKKMNLATIDLDYEIEKHEGVSISTIFKNKGEVYFRDLEAEVLREVIKLSVPHIISTGGGAPCFHDNLAKILDSGTSIYLSLKPETLYRRHGKKAQNRPLLTGLEGEALYEELLSKLKKRGPFYERAQIIIPCDGKNIPEITQEIYERLLKEQAKS
ncbi:MAG TPA: shikimate kinase [Cytophagales bacterium]|jgi:shikimate kinase|nr:shikimate kinase [Cytophagales bacterium]